MAFVIAELRKFILAVLAGALIVRLESVRLGTWNPFSVLGRASYSLYALHTPITFYLLEVGAPWYLVIVTNMAAALASHLIIERPGIWLGKQYLTGKLFAKQNLRPSANISSLGAPSPQGLEPRARP